MGRSVIKFTRTIAQTNVQKLKVLLVIIAASGPGCKQDRDKDIAQHRRRSQEIEPHRG